MSSAPSYPSTIGRVLTRSATRLPDKLALAFADRRWTYLEPRAVGRVAARLLAQGLQPGDRVAAYGKNSDAYLLLYLGCAGRSSARARQLQCARERARLPAHPVRAPRRLRRPVAL